MSVICINVVTNKRNVLIFHVCQFLPGPTGLDSASEPCVLSVYLHPRSVHLHPWCLPTSIVSTCIPGVCLLPQCLPVPLVSARFRSVYLCPWCLPTSAVSTCAPGVCPLPQCPPASLVSARFHSVHLRPWCLPTSIVSTCVPGVCPLPQCPPAPGVVRPCNSRLGRSCRSDGDVWSH